MSPDELSNLASYLEKGRQHEAVLSFRIIGVYNVIVSWGGRRM